MACTSCLAAHLDCLHLAVHLAYLARGPEEKDHNWEVLATDIKKGHAGPSVETKISSLTGKDSDPGVFVCKRLRGLLRIQAFVASHRGHRHFYRVLDEAQ